MVMMGLSCDKMSSELTMSTRWSLMVMTELSYDKNEFWTHDEHFVVTHGNDGIVTW